MIFHSRLSPSLFSFWSLSLFFLVCDNSLKIVTNNVATINRYNVIHRQLLATFFLRSYMLRSMHIWMCVCLQTESACIHSVFKWYYSVDQNCRFVCRDWMGFFVFRCELIVAFWRYWLQTPFDWQIDQFDWTNYPCSLWPLLYRNSPLPVDWVIRFPKLPMSDWKAHRHNCLGKLDRRKTVLEIGIGIGIKIRASVRFSIWLFVWWFRF